MLWISGGKILGDITARNPSLTDISGGDLSGNLLALDDSVVRITGTDFNLPLGDITATCGTLTGILADGTPLNLPFGRASTATITLEDAGNLDILRVDQIGMVIAYSNINDFITNQNGSALGPPVSNFATARGFFSVAGKYYAVLGDGMIVEYPRVPEREGGLRPSRGGITRSGSSGSFTYNAKPGREDMPVNFVSFYDALRFANWLHDGQGAGDTETGTYTAHRKKKQRFREVREVSVLSTTPEGGSGPAAGMRTVLREGRLDAIAGEGESERIGGAQ
jgi:hypothetical protein